MKKKKFTFVLWTKIEFHLILLLPKNEYIYFKTNKKKEARDLMFWITFFFERERKCLLQHLQYLLNISCFLQKMDYLARDILPNDWMEMSFRYMKINKRKVYRMKWKHWRSKKIHVSNESWLLLVIPIISTKKKCVETQI